MGLWYAAKSPPALRSSRADAKQRVVSSHTHIDAPESQPANHAFLQYSPADVAYDRHARCFSCGVVARRRLSSRASFARLYEQGTDVQTSYRGLAWGMQSLLLLSFGLFG